MKIIEKLVEFIGWLQLCIFPIVISCILGGIFYYYNPFGIGIYFSIISIILGIIAGVLYATKVHQKEGTVNHLSKLIRTPELEKKEQNK